MSAYTRLRAFVNPDDEAAVLTTGAEDIATLLDLVREQHEALQPLIQEAQRPYTHDNSCGLVLVADDPCTCRRGQAITAAREAIQHGIEAGV